MATDIIARGLAISARQQSRTVVGNNCNVPTGSATTTGNQYMSQHTLYFPAGGKAISLTFAGFRTATSTETDLTGASPMNVGVAVVPAPWNIITNYAIGDSVTWNMTQASGGYTGVSIYKALVANAGSMPTPSNTNWSASSVTYTQCTLRAQLACGARTTTKSDGTTITEGYWETDPISALIVPVGGYLAVRAWIQNGGGIASAPLSGYTSGSFFASGATTPDISSGANPSSPSQAGGPTGYIPTLAMGFPLVNDSGKTVAIIGDSIATNVVGGSSVSSLSVSAGGTGYTAADIGKRYAIDNTGATATSIAVSAIGLITNVSGGAVTGVRLISGGSYANTGLPTGTQGIVAIDAMVGTGLTLTIATGAGSNDPGDNTYATGALRRALSQAGIRWTALTSPGDTLQGWATRDYSRMAIIAKANVSSVIIQPGTNDFTAGRTLVQMQANATGMANQALALGVKGVFLCTLLPVPTTTDGYATLGNQAANGLDAVRLAYNAWVRTSPSPFAGFFDPAAAIEDGGASAPTGKVVVNGTVGYALIDGRHPTPVGGVPLTQAAYTAKLSQLL